MIWSILLTSAFAAPEARPKTMLDAPADAQSRASMMEVNMRTRYLMVPDSLLDVWFYDNDDPGANSFKRPKVRAYTLGVEYVIKPRPMNWIIYVEYLGSQTAPGYWDDVDDGIADHDDGDWVEASGFGGWFVGGNYAHEIPISPIENDVWVSLLMGGGLGIGFVKGDLLEWNPGSDPQNADPDCEPDAPAYLRYDKCQVDGVKSVPGVLPMIDLSLGFRVNFADRANIRIEGGIHDMIYFGSAIGGVF